MAVAPERERVVIKTAVKSFMGFPSVVSVCWTLSNSPDP